MSFRLALLFCILTLGGVCVPVQAQEDAPEIPSARQAAQDWLQQFHAGALEATWTGAADLLRATMTQEQWQRQNSRTRNRLGAPRSRRLTQIQHRDSLRQAPEAGPFRLFRARSEFTTGLYVETILVAREEAGWAVAGYEVARVAAPPQ